jgi:hypothetical protein
MNKMKILSKGRKVNFPKDATLSSKEAATHVSQHYDYIVYVPKNGKSDKMGYIFDVVGYLDPAGPNPDNALATINFGSNGRIHPVIKAVYDFDDTIKLAKVKRFIRGVLAGKRINYGFDVVEKGGLAALLEEPVDKSPNADANHSYDQLENYVKAASVDTESRRSLSSE